MKTRTAIIAAFLAFAPVAALAIPHATTPLNPATRGSFIPSGTFIRIRMLQMLSSSFSKANDPFLWVVSDDVKVGDRVVIPAGTQGTGKVLKVSPAHGGRTPGWLRLQFDPIKLSDGTLVDLAITHASVVLDENAKNGYAPAAEQVANMTVPYLFLLDALRKGDDMTIQKNAVFHVAVLEDTFVTANAVAVSATPVPASAPPAAPSAASSTDSTAPAPAAPASPDKPDMAAF